MNDFEVVGTRGYYRPHAHVTLEQALEMIIQAVRYARERDLHDLVINALRLTGYRIPRVFARYAFFGRLIESSGASLRVVFVVPPELIDFQKIGVLIFQNRGGSGDVFATEAEALAWLDASRVPRDRLPAISNGTPPAT